MRLLLACAILGARCIVLISHALGGHSCQSVDLKLIARRVGLHSGSEWVTAYKAACKMEEPHQRAAGVGIWFARLSADVVLAARSRGCTTGSSTLDGC